MGMTGTTGGFRDAFSCFLREERGVANATTFFDAYGTVR